MVKPTWEFDPDINTAFIEGTEGREPAPDPGYEDFQGGRRQNPGNPGNTP